MKLRHLLPLLALAGAGCGDDDPEHLRAQGAAVVVLPDGTETGFQFDDYTRLDDDRVSPLDGRLAGHCTIGVGEDGMHDVLSVAIVRTADETETDLGIRSLVLRLDTPTRGSIETNLGGTKLTAESSETCTLTRPYVERQDGLAAVMADCQVFDADGNSATAMVDLMLTGCEVE